MESVKKLINDFKIEEGRSQYLENEKVNFSNTLIQKGACYFPKKVLQGSSKKELKFDQRYIVKDWCGSGGFGNVFKAEDSQKYQTVAIKITEDYSKMKE